MGSPIPILFRDEHLLVVDKPSGLLSVGVAEAKRTLQQVLVAEGLRVLPVHRLDREVSGAIVFALDEETRAALEALFRERRLRKTYWALARGRLRQREGELKFPLLEERGMARVSARGKPSTTRYRTLREHARATELEIDLVTGRYNQIRVHFAHAGHPLVGETKYARRKEDPFGFPRVALHSWKLSLEHPRTGAALDIECPLSTDLLALLERARSNGGRPQARA